ncbi:hypothetical protein MKX07_003830 [Trichoderma sp. CBMAI-0711]|uniref:Gfd2/YDR514C-like C-terminal domain-containing protein n=1 Tax=Trichoderma parareesei TaxID=858221 RepID=A0A2H2ZKJ2_TRIPA|nr:hypothetical protein MKX07_003830 [Trichoderma sp. CBMAI-0711]OTA03680.1 hypothetical protein A9Z42_0041790 [Trichoderma parareesei]
MSDFEASSQRPAPARILNEEQTPAQPKRQVFLREGTVILRWIFGFYDSRNLPGWKKPPGWPQIGSTWQSQKPNTRFKDVTFVAIDMDELEERNDGMPIRFHIGISILQTKDLHGLCHDPFPITGFQTNIIRSYHWAVEDSQYFAKNDSRFCFGQHECIPLSGLEGRLKELLKPFSPRILVAHGISRERIVLRRLNIDLNQIFEIDTAKAARYPLQELHDSTLRKLLQDFDIPCEGGLLHFAGNDAHFALRALLMIAVRDARRELKDLPTWVPVFEAVAQAPLPPIPLTRAEKAAIKRREREAARLQDELYQFRERWVEELERKKQPERRPSSTTSSSLDFLAYIANVRPEDGR